MATALSQQPYLNHEKSGGRHYYRLRDKADLTNVFRLQQEYTYEPVMAEQFLLRFNSEQDLIAAREHLLEFELSDSAAFANGNPRLFHTTLSDSNA